MSFIRDAIKSCDSSDAMEAIIKEQLETLMQLAEKNSGLAKARIEASLKDGKINDDLFVPVTKVIEQHAEVRAITTETNAEIIPKISASISQFFNPGKQEILNGISGILSTAFDALMGSGEGMELTQDLYVVAVEYPSVIRLDFSIWMRNTRAEGLRKKCKNALSVVAYKSAVDIRKLDFATFVTIYSSLLSRCFGEDLKQVDALLDAAENIYRRLGLNVSSDNPPSNGLLRSARQKPALSLPLMSPVSCTPAEVGDF